MQKTSARTAFYNNSNKDANKIYFNTTIKHTQKAKYLNGKYTSWLIFHSFSHSKVPLAFKYIPINNEGTKLFLIG